MIRESSIDFAMNCLMTLKICVRLLGKLIQRMVQQIVVELTGPCHFRCRRSTGAQGTTQVNGVHALLVKIGHHLSKASNPDVPTLWTPENRTRVLNPGWSQPLRCTPLPAQRRRNRRVQTPLLPT